MLSRFGRLAISSEGFCMNTTKLDFSKLLGFASVSEEVTNALDFQDDTMGAKLGAKIGKEELNPSRKAKRQ
jgi:hypothetical protein